MPSGPTRATNRICPSARNSTSARSAGRSRSTISTWYDIEKNYDFVYLSASEDGKTWKTLKTPSGTDKNITGANLGWGYTGTSGKWIDETVDLSAYAGKKVQLRFDYITDAAINGRGMMIDDMSIPEINYQSDLEKDDGGWKGDGFVRVANKLPQTFKVTLIKMGAQTTVEPLALDATQHGSVKLDLGNGVERGDRGGERDDPLHQRTGRFQHQRALNSIL